MIDKLIKGSKKLKDKVIEIFDFTLFCLAPSLPFLDPDHSVVNLGLCVVFLGCFLVLIEF